MDSLEFPGPIVVEFILIEAVSGDRVSTSLEEIFQYLLDHNECEFLIVANWREKATYETNKDLVERNAKFMLRILDKMKPWYREHGFVVGARVDEVKPFPLEHERASCSIHLRLNRITPKGEN